MVAAFPTLTVEVAFTTAPTSTPTWTDVTAYVLSIKIRRGRDNEFGPMQMGTAEVVFDNSDRRFDPSYAAGPGPYYGNLKPMRRIRIRATDAYEWRPGSWWYTDRALFSGYVDGWPQSWVDGIIPVVGVRACDGFKLLGLVELGTSYPEELSGSRINRVLNDCGWSLGGYWVLDSSTNSQLGSTTILGPYGDRVLADGDSTMMAQTVTNANALQYLNDITNSEYGMLFVNAYGQVQFNNRNFFYGTFAQTTFSDEPDYMHYTDYQLEYDDQYVYNDIRMQRVDGTLKTASDATSQVDYFKRTLQDDRLLLTDDSIVQDRANYLLGRYKEPHYCCRNLAMERDETGEQQLWMAALEIGQRFIVERHPQGGAVISNEYIIQGIEHEIGTRGRDWTTTYKLSLADPQSYWVLCQFAGDTWSGNSILGSTTTLAY